MAKVFCPLPPGWSLSGFQVFKFLEGRANGVAVYIELTGDDNKIISYCSIRDYYGFPVLIIDITAYLRRSYFPLSAVASA